MSRPPTPRAIENLLDREVGGKCPLCGNTPLVRAHTIKKYPEVGYDINYMLSICHNCETRVEAGKISRDYLHKIKRFLKIGLSNNGRWVNKNYLPLRLVTNCMRLGSNEADYCDSLISYRGVPIIWVEEHQGLMKLNAKFYDKRGTVTKAINRNIWTSEAKPYIIRTENSAGGVNLIISSNNDDTRICISCTPDALQIYNSIFYTPSGKTEICGDGTVVTDTMTFSNNNSQNCNSLVDLQ